MDMENVYQVINKDPILEKIVPIGNTNILIIYTIHIFILIIILIHIGIAVDIIICHMDIANGAAVANVLIGEEE